ncbi:glycine cleavage system protein GcvH [Fusibacter sp. JL298sf-3]
MKIVNGLYYTEDHEWVKVEGKKGWVGITDFAQDALGDIVYVEMPEIDETYDAEDNFGTIESVKAASDMLMPVTGKVVAVNEALDDDPALLNQDAYANWIVEIEIEDEGALASLMDAKAYEAFCEEEA